MNQHSENLNKIFTFIVGIVAMYFAWQWWQGQTIFASVVAPVPDDNGMVSVAANGQASFMMDILNLLFTAISGIGFTVLTVVLGGIRMLTSIFGPMFARAMTPATPQAAPVAHAQVQSPAPAKAVRHRATAPAAAHMPPEQVGDISKLLVQAALDGDRTLTIALAEKLHGKQFLRAVPTEAAPTKAKATPRKKA